MRILVSQVKSLPNPANINEYPDNLDHDLALFLKKWFPTEVKTKQRYNELMAGIDQYGEVYASQKCVQM